jgi:uncharacterized protein YutE (UPF0331/DUF86 family)
MPEPYLDSIEQHCLECREDLDALSAIAAERPFSRIERRAAERALQVLIEACIGAAKFRLKTEHKNLPLDAYENFVKLAELQKISLEELKQWRKIVGMRNALAHDYLTHRCRIITNSFVRAVIRFSDRIHQKAQAMYGCTLTEQGNPLCCRPSSPSR